MTNYEPNKSHTSMNGAAAAAANLMVRPTALDLSVDLRQSCPGDVIDVPYELTISEGMLDFWHGAFHDQNRISTSTPFARKIGLQDRMLPFTLVSFLACSMTHADAALVQVALNNAVYHWPAFAGDTFTKTFEVRSVRNTSSGDRSIVNFTCNLKNQRGKVCMTANKQMLFPFRVGENGHVSSSHAETKESIPRSSMDQDLKNHILSKADTIQSLGNQSLAALNPGQAILHSMCRSLSFSQSQQLASLAKLSHELFFNSYKYDPSAEILVPGELVHGLVVSAASRDLHEVLHEEVHNVSYINHVHPGDTISAITYVNSIDDSICTGDLECVNITTLGVKNVNLKDQIDKLPLEIFHSDNSTTKGIERICKEKCPELSGKIAVYLKRQIIRQTKRKNMFLL